VTIRLRPVREDELAGWLDESKREYVRDLVEHAGHSRAGAERKAERDFASLLQDPQRSDDQALFVIEDQAGGVVGRAWLADREGAEGTHAFVYDVFLEERLRGRGLGRRAMQLLEEEARRRGHTRIRLNVFGGNEVARSLYRSLGYAELAVTMGKDLA
jgi:GNAT superfamily N-acetyltransferase